MVYLFITSLIWAFSFGLIGNVLKGIDPLVVAGVRLAIALLVFLPFLRLKDLEATDRLKLFGLGAVQFGIMYICYLSAFRFIPSHLVALFSVLTPLYVVLIHDFRHRRFTPRYLLAALLSVIGAAVIKAKSGDTGTFWAGFILMQISGIAFAFGQVVYRDWKRSHAELKEHSVFALLYAGGALTALSASFITGSGPQELSAASSSQLGVIVYLGIVASGLGFFLWNKGAVQSTPGVLAAFNNFLVPLAIVVSLFVFREIEGLKLMDLINLLIGSGLIATAIFIGRKAGDQDLAN
ncbi:MAG: EamA family transporter [Verrucomicrobiota bacterium]